MNILIICEGNTDKHLIGFHLEKKENYKYQKRSEFFTIQLEKNQFQINLSNQENNITIVSVGGKTRIFSFFEKVKEYISQVRDKQKLINKIVIMIDRDEDSERDLLNMFNNKISNINTWEKMSISNQMFDEVDVDFFLLVIPPESNGAMERFVINSLKDKYDYIVDELEVCVDNISKKNKEFRNNERLKDKAKLGCVLSILSPEWSLDKLTEKMKQINWEELDKFNRVYSKIFK
ncbi:hypothetical protein X275_09080 [Marinitoga sp. 1197]|uniref:DUF3226 domain-containing protein n=1 Tax=Marinitoga sp. 1197 TaxID=1428449 RepID=UPI00064171A4|nr:DUF3226 domain-containing protein [Marinitoga sp. 1197]KLO21514.1 hypothetical protein X275_09080 [Marinitoga sp. 1197]